ncbi:MAG TPA: hypothetical protein VGS57_02145 [Thermoanaerobaculia bacterium]|nr:hypothetical protein [Thermoanaerobaculia bacterium]
MSERSPNVSLPASDGAATTFCWDFFGPRAEGTARHFLRHLDEFLQRERVEGCATAVEELRAGHWVVTCRTPAEAATAVRQALRPRREIEPT